MEITPQNIAKKFEISILRPLHIYFITFAIICLLTRSWLYLFGAILGLLYLGIIGSRLHPLQSASDLTKGPTTGPAAIVESQLLSSLPPQLTIGLINNACTHVGILIGLTVGAMLWLIAGWHWYYAIIITGLVFYYSGMILKTIFITKYILRK